MIGTMAIIVIVSVMNGFTDLIAMFYSKFDPDLRITPVEGKFFDPATIDTNKIKSVNGVAHYAEILEQVAMLKYGKQQCAATIKGVPANYPNYTDVDQLLIAGKYMLRKGGVNYALVGRGIANYLQIGLSLLEPIHIYIPKRGNRFTLNPTRALNHDFVYPAGIFAVLEDVDAKYILVSKDFAAQLFNTGNKISAIEIDVNDNADLETVKQKIKQIAGPMFHVKNKQEQHELIFKTMKSEKWAVYAIMVFILLLASGNMIGNLSMLYIDKQDDIRILRSIGCTEKQINRIFLYEGWLISLLGGIIGALLGVLICYLQLKFGFIKLPGNNGSFVISAYPVKLIFSDILLAFIAVSGIGFLASWYPVKFMSSKYINSGNID